MKHLLKNVTFCVYKCTKGMAVQGLGLNFATEVTGFKETFPGLTPHILTVDICFKLPITRQFLLAHGICSSSVKSLKYILTNKGFCNQRGQVTQTFLLTFKKYFENS